MKTERRIYKQETRTKKQEKARNKALKHTALVMEPPKFIMTKEAFEDLKKQNFL